MHRQTPCNEMETALLQDVRLGKEWGLHNTIQSNPPLHPGILGVGAQDQFSTSAIKLMCQCPTHLIKNMQKNNNC